VSRHRPPFTAVGLGEVLWDLLPADRQLGGAPANFAWHAQNLGARGIVASRVGDDVLGREVLDRLRELALEMAWVTVDPVHPTGTVSVALSAAGVPCYTIHQDVAWDFIATDRRLLELAARADAVCFGSLAQRAPVSRAAIAGFLQATRPGCLRMFDVNLRQSFFSREVIEASLARSNLLKLNEEELPAVARLLGLAGDENTVLDALLRRYALRVVALTRGPHGSLLQTPSARSVHAGIPVRVVDTVGAGDAFTAAVVMGWLLGRDLDWINAQANRVASFVCSRPGATPSLPDELTAPFRERPPR